MDFAVKTFHQHALFGDSPPFQIIELLQVKTLADRFCFGLVRCLTNVDARQSGCPKSNNRIQDSMSAKRSIDVRTSSLDQFHVRRGTTKFSTLHLLLVDISESFQILTTLFGFLPFTRYIAYNDFSMTIHL